MPVYDAPEDDDVRQTYNFAPGNHGLVYRADVPDYGAGDQRRAEVEDEDAEDRNLGPQVEDPKETRYKLQSMRWGKSSKSQYLSLSYSIPGLIPFWTKRNPDYGSVMRTINARDDSLAEDRGMWTTMKKNKRCVVIAQGFYEWLKKNGGKEKIPHYIKRKDGQLMCFAGLWDCVQYEGSEERIYTYTIVTTDSNKQLSFLHDRMPVILENGSEALRTWLDPSRHEWSKELRSVLRPFNGELECYPVDQAVGKVGNNSPSFIIPVASAENKKNIANFFSNARKKAEGPITKQELKKEEHETKFWGIKVEHDKPEQRQTVNEDAADSNAPLPVPPSPTHDPRGTKRSHETSTEEIDNTASSKVAKVVRKQVSASENDAAVKHEAQAPPAASPEGKPSRKTRSAIKNIARDGPTKTGNGSQRITNFFNK